MPKRKARIVRSMRGVEVDFDLMEIKAQIASAPKPVEVKEREDFVDRRLRRRLKRQERRLQAEKELAQKTKQVDVEPEETPVEPEPKVALREIPEPVPTKKPIVVQPIVVERKTDEKPTRRTRTIKKKEVDE